MEEYAELLAILGTRTPMPFARPLRDGVSSPPLGGEDTYSRGKEGDAS
ncbi:hypothetical protein NKH18_29090 [Streptomyces sp. M10(2022)]